LSSRLLNGREHMTTEHTVVRSGKSKRKPFNSNVVDVLSRPLPSTTPLVLSDTSSICICGFYRCRTRSAIQYPREVVKSGDIVKVKVLEVEVARKRIALTLRLDDEPGGRAERPAQGMPRDGSRASMTSSAPRKPSGGGALAEALRRASEKGGSGKNKS